VRWCLGWVASVTVLAVGGAAFSCRQIVGINASPQEDLTSTACGLPYGTNACASCASAACCGESSACAADAVFCAPYESCLSACKGDPACRSQCTIDHKVPASSAGPVSALSACVAANCAESCGLTCGAFAGYLSEPDASTACQNCLVQSSCDDARGCGTSAECDAFWRCQLACQTFDCKAACASEHEAGAGLFRPLYKDFSGACAAACGYGDYWACAGHVSWPASESETVTLTWWVYDFDSQKGVAGADVSICTACPCPTAATPVLKQGQTDAAGFFTLQYPQMLSPTGIGTPICVQTSAPGYLPTFTYFEFPISQPSFSIDDNLTPKTSVGIALQTQSAQQVDNGANGAGYDAGRGTVGVGAYDCLGSPGTGVDVAINVRDPALLALGAIDAGPDAWPTASVTNGRAYFLSVPPGTVTLTATLPGRAVAVSQISVSVIGATTTQVAMVPTP
jgi:hypothetical protein